MVKFVSSIIATLAVVFITGSVNSASLESVINPKAVEHIAGFVLYRVDQGNVQYVLLQKASELDDWSNPKGHIEEGEDPVMGATRETFEETAYISTDYTAYLDQEIYFEYTTNSGDEKKVTLFPAKLTVENKPVEIDPDEHNAYVWVNYENGVNIIKQQYKDAFIRAGAFIRVQEGLESA